MPWKRPSSVPTGQVWLRFEGKGKDGNPGQKFQIRDLAPEYKEECLDLMQETFLRDEPLCLALDIISDKESVTQIRDDWEEFISQGVSLTCFTEEDGKPQTLVGFNIVVVRTKDEEEVYGTKGEAWKKLLKTLSKTESLLDVFEHYGVDAYVSCSGLTVKREFRGQNIGARLLEARKPLSKALGLSVAASVFTAKTSQVLAKKCGFELLGTLHYSAMRQHGIDLCGGEELAPVVGSDTVCAELRGIRYTWVD